MPSSRNPKFQRQMNRSDSTTDSKDCGPRTIQMGIDALTMGEKVPSIETIRKKMGRQGNQTTNTSDAKKCVESYTSQAMGNKRNALKYARYTGVQHQDILDDAAKRGEYIQLCIDYGKFNDATGKKTGDPNFRGGHSVGVFGWRQLDDGTIQWKLWDPLDDKRRSGIPQGPRWVKKAHLMAAWKSFGGYFGILRGGQKK